MSTTQKAPTISEKFDELGQTLLQAYNDHVEGKISIKELNAISKATDKIFSEIKKDIKAEKAQSRL